MSNPAAALGQEIGKLFEASIVERLRPEVEARQSRISEVEVLMKTNRRETLLLRFGSVADTVSGLVVFMDERSDVSSLLEGKSG